MNRLPRAAAAAVLLLVLAGCSSDSTVGSKDNTSFDEREGSRIGQITASPTPTPARTTAKPKPTRTPATVRTTTARPVTTTPAPARTTQAAAAFTVRIVATGQGFDPFNFVVTKGTTVRVVNDDKQARTFTSDTGAFDSKMIPPGKSWTYVANKAGTFNFHDETRPFAVGRMEVTG